MRECCEEYVRTSVPAAWSRRGFLGAVAATGGAAVTTSVFGEAVLQASFGAEPGGNVLVVLSFRGGIDGLGVVVPHGDPAYAAARPTLQVPTASLVAADSMFGLHPELAPLSWAWDSGEFGAVHAVGLEVPNRSHFSATEEVEEANPGSNARRGWINRMVGLDPNPTPIDAIALGSSTPPTMVEGPSPTVAADNLSSISLAGGDKDDVWSTRRKQALQTVWGKASGPLKAGFDATWQTVGTLHPIAAATYTPSVTYPTAWPSGDLSNALMDAAKLIKADIGTQVITVDFGGWDMHSDYGTLQWGRMQTQLGAFAASMSAFLQDLGPLRSKVTVATISEFGRRLEENGNQGLDHGWGNMMLLFGGGVDGGKYHGTWPGLSHGNQHDDDLQVTTDYRQVLAEIVNKRLGTTVSKVFPGLTYAPIGVLT
jgi:uncharacterized protein (DUF1501 family)